MNESNENLEQMNMKRAGGMEKTVAKDVINLLEFVQHGGIRTRNSLYNRKRKSFILLLTRFSRSS